MGNADTQFDTPLAPYSDTQRVKLPIVDTTLLTHSPVVALDPNNQNDALVVVANRYSYNKTLLLIVTTIKHFRQFIYGSLLGTILALTLLELRIASQAVVPLTPLVANHRQTSTLTFLTLELFRHSVKTKVTISTVKVPPPPLASSVNQALQPVMMDRFYLPHNPSNHPVDGQEPSVSTAIVVDRFYFAHQTDDGTFFNSRQRTHEMAATFMMPPPQPIDNRNPMVSGNRSGASPHLAIAPSLRAAKPYTLVGIIQTGQFSAALFQTDDNSYSVRLGEPVGQSYFKLVDLNDKAAILSDGEEQIILYVGDTL
jgi:hypothetical protein